MISFLIKAECTCGFILLLFLVVSKDITAQQLESTQIQNLHQHLENIASDQTNGRLTSTQGYKQAAEYSVKVFQESGLLPGYTDEQGQKSYLQPVPFTKNIYSPVTSIIIRKKGEEHSFNYSAGNFIFINDEVKNENGSFISPVFIGYGIHEPQAGWDDLKGVNIEGKWVIILNGIPPSDFKPAFPKALLKKYSDWKMCDSLKLALLKDNKAAGLIVLPDKRATDNWEGVLLSNLGNLIRYGYTDSINHNSGNVLNTLVVHPILADNLFAGEDYDPVVNTGKYHSYILDKTEIKINVDCQKENASCCNVIALLPGTDPILKNEYITVGAHLDHLGTVRNHVYNGANDDASGCAIILESAKALAKSPLKRSVLFILYTGEELNLAGSRYFLEHSPVPIDHITLNINIEQIGSKNRDYPGYWGIGSPQFQQSYMKAAASSGNKNIKFDSIEKSVNLLKGQVDLWSYYQKNIPGVMLSSGGFKDHHTKNDNIDRIDFDHLNGATTLLYNLIAVIGN